ncbi:MAG: hypothetical protein ACRCZO_03510 [Cetobacterium sp.]
MEEIEVVGLSEANGELVLLTADFAEFTAPLNLFNKSVEELWGISPFF